MKDQKGQILLVVFMLMIFTGLIIGGAAFLWQSAVNTTALEKDSLRAFYIAQAGIERARAEIAYEKNDDYNHTFSNQPFGGGSYNLDIVRIAADTKEIISTGKFGNSTREIKMRVGVSGPGGPPYGNAWGFHAKHDDTWTEQ
jgi:Tfp pilus assembly protein PilX